MEVSIMDLLLGPLGDLHIPPPDAGLTATYQTVNSLTAGGIEFRMYLVSPDTGEPVDQPTEVIRVNENTERQHLTAGILTA
jgi:hypothetical protein